MADALGGGLAACAGRLARRDMPAATLTPTEKGMPVSPAFRMPYPSPTCRKSVRMRKNPETMA